MSERVELDEMHNEIMILLREKRDLINDINEEEQRRKDAREQYEKEVSSLKSRWMERTRSIEEKVDDTGLVLVGVEVLKERFKQELQEINDRYDEEKDICREDCFMPAEDTDWFFTNPKLGK